MSDRGDQSDHAAVKQGAPGRRGATDILRDNATLLPFLLVGGGGITAFQLLIARALPPAAYAETIAVLAILSLLATPATVIQTVVARATARLLALGRFGELRAGARRTGIQVGAAALLVTAGLGAASPLLAKALQLTSPWPVLVASIAAGLHIVEPLVRGATQGGRDFVAHGIILVAHGAGRIALGGAAVLLGGGATGAVLASVASASSGTAAGGLALRRMMRRWPASPPAAAPRVRLSNHVRVAAIMTAMAALLHLDLLFVKAFHPTSVAAEYAALALVARSVFWVGATIAVVLLPYVVRRATRGEEFVRAYLASLALVLLTAGVMAALVLSSPEVAYSLVFGDKYTPNVELLPAYAAAAAMLAVTNITAGLHIGASHLRVWFPLAVLILATVVGLALAHESPGQVLAVVAAADAAAMLYMLAEAIALARRAPRAAGDLSP